MQTLHGCGTALATPFARDGSLDERALRDFAEWQIAEGIHFLVPCGTTGEAATMTAEERARVVAIVVEVARGRVPVVAGATSNDTRAAVEEAKRIRDAGADYILSATPYYNKPTSAGLERHFAAVAEAAERPLILYNVPGRTALNMDARTTLRLAGRPGIAGVKEASGNLAQITEILSDRPDGFTVLSGDDALTFAITALGGDGVISVASNEVPGPMSRMVEQLQAGDLEAAREIHFRLLPLMNANFLESNPIPVKAALARMGKMQEVLRLPLTPLSDAHRIVLEEALRAAGALV
ncbi:MAG: 4-hydroxy-tetrahydrodipicolinate synthase [Gemmatimonadota bacterium]